MHDAARLFVKHAARMAPAGPVCEIGSCNVNGSVRPYFRGPYIGVDIRSGPGVDIVADGATWDGDGDTFAVVVCCEVLEHATDQAGLCRNILRLLAADGVAIITAATPDRVPHSGIDGEALREGEFYRGVTADDLREWFHGCRGIAINESEPGDIYAVVTR